MHKRLYALLLFCWFSPMVLAACRIKEANSEP